MYHGYGISLYFALKYQQQHHLLIAAPHITTVRHTYFFMHAQPEAIPHNAY